MHGIQTSGNCIRNITTDALAGIAPDEVVDPRPLPRSCASGARCTRSSPSCRASSRSPSPAPPKTAPPPPGTTSACSLRRNAAGRWASRCWWAAAWAARRSSPATHCASFVPWHQILNYLEAVVRVYNRYGRRDNKYKARIKILVKAEGQRFIDEVEAEYRAILRKRRRAAHHPQAELDRVAGQLCAARAAARNRPRQAPTSCAQRPKTLPAAGCSATCTAQAPACAR
jgi:sulfite reductase (NADPH) hemoprotein beta-component